MSDYIVTDTELTETADAIRAKTGDSSAIEWESGTGFADAVAAISGDYDCSFSSSGNALDPFSDIYLGYKIPIKGKLTINHTGNQQTFTLSNFQKWWGFYEVEINSLSVLQRSGTCFCYGIPSRKIIFNVPYVKITGNMNFFFNDCRNLEEVSGEFALEGGMGSYAFYNGNYPNLLKEFRLKQNATTASPQFSFCTLLSDESLISIANGLNESVSSISLRLSSGKRSRCSEILGTVSLDSTETYHVFTQDAQGTVTLADFITNTKGWTLA